MNNCEGNSAVTNTNISLISRMQSHRNRVLPVAVLLLGSMVIGPVQASNVEPPSDVAYVTNETSHDVTVFDTLTNTAIATIPVGEPTTEEVSPTGVAITPDGTQVYVVNEDEGSISVIDTATNTVVDAIKDLGVSPLAIRITKDGKLAYVTINGNNAVSVIDTTTNTVVATIEVGTEPEGVALTPDETRVYVANEGSGTVSVIDTDPASPNFRTLVATINDGIGPATSGVAVTPDGTEVYVTNFGAFIPPATVLPGSVSVIDTATNTVVARIEDAFGFPLNQLTGVTITPDGTRAYVTTLDFSGFVDPDLVYVIDTETNTVVDAVGVGSNPLQVVLTQDGTRLYVTNIDVLELVEPDIVSVIDTDPASPNFHSVIGTVEVGMQPAGVAIAPTIDKTVKVTLRCRGEWIQGGKVQWTWNGEPLIRPVFLAPCIDEKVTQIVPVLDDPNVPDRFPDGVQVTVMGQDAAGMTMANCTFKKPDIDFTDFSSLRSRFNCKADGGGRHRASMNISIVDSR